VLIFVKASDAGFADTLLIMNVKTRGLSWL